MTETRNPIYVYPEEFDVEMSSETQTRYRGIFEVPVYTADIQMEFNFDFSQTGDLLTGKQVAHWDEATLRVFLSSNKALRGEAVLKADDLVQRLEPISSGQSERIGISADVGDPREIEGFTLNLGINGAQTLAASATGRTTRITLKSDWPDPSFYGAFFARCVRNHRRGFRGIVDRSALGPVAAAGDKTVSRPESAPKRQHGRALHNAERLLPKSVAVGALWYPVHRVDLSHDSDVGTKPAKRRATRCAILDGRSCSIGVCATDGRLRRTNRLWSRIHLGSRRDDWIV